MVLTPLYRNQSTPSASAGSPVATTSTGDGRFSAQVPITVPSSSSGNEISVRAAFETYEHRRVAHKKVTCEPGGPLYPAWYPVGP